MDPRPLILPVHETGKIRAAFFLTGVPVQGGAIADLLLLTCMGACHALLRLCSRFHNSHESPTPNPACP